MANDQHLHPKEAGQTSNEPIAVIGFAFELPGGLTTEEELWDTLINARSHSTDIHHDRWNLNGFYRQGTSKRGVHNVRSSHLLERDIAAFDPAFFGITVNEAHAMDPQQRILLETSYRALENAGISLEAVSDSNAGVFVGTFSSDYAHMNARDADMGAAYRATGSGTAIMSNRLSWFYNLKGPSVSVDTGCSASLVALHLACQSLLGRECDLGLVGACNLIIDPDTMMTMSDSGFLSPDGKCHSFDARANGYGRGEGSGVVLVKRLSDALRHGDTVRAVIRATDTNQDGFTPGITQPNFSSQKALIQRAYRKAGLAMSDTRSFEAHGTGTPIGDPIEARAIWEAFEGVVSPDTPLTVTALKPNVGHLENASGVASLIKTILSLERGVIPPIAGLESLNPAIRLHAGLEFAREPTVWPTAGDRRASINSFGYGGTNVHVVVDGAAHYFSQEGLDGFDISQTADQNGIRLQDDPQERKLLVFSAADRDGVERTVSDLARCLGHDMQPGLVDDLSFTLSEKRSRLSWRSFAVVDPSRPLRESLSDSLAVASQASTSPNVAFVFTGQGAQWATMGQELLAFDVFRNSMEQSDRQLQSLGSGWSLLDELVQPHHKSRLQEAHISQPVNTALQIALLDLLQSWNVTPAAAIGHSSGEIAAAYCVGSLSKSAALKVAYYRGLVADLAVGLMQSPAGMLAVAMSKEDAEAEIKALFGDHDHADVSIACINSPGNVTVSGYTQHLDRLGGVLDDRNIFNRLVKTGVPYHSRLMDSVTSTYRDLMRCVESDQVGSSDTLFFSSVFPGQMSCQSGPDYWIQNLVSPVEFSDGVSHMLEHSKKSQVRKLGATTTTKGAEITHLVEIGPHAALKGPIRDILKHLKLDKTVVYSSALWRGENSMATLLGLAGQLFAGGFPVDIRSANNYTQNTKMLTHLPGYNFNHSSRYWLESRRSRQYRSRAQGYHELLGTPADDSCPEDVRWRHYVSTDEHRWVADHRVLGLVVYPAAGLLVMALEAARQLRDVQKIVSGFRFEHVVIGRALVVPAEPPGVETLISLRKDSHRHHDSSEYYSFNIRAFANESWYECCRGNITIEYRASADQLETLTRQTQDRVLTQLDESVDSEHAYSQFASLGFVYGPAFRGLGSIRCCGDSRRATAKLHLLQWKEAHASDHQSHIIHPAALDGILQLSMTALTRGGRDAGDAMIPTGIPSLHITSTLSEDLSDPVADVRVEAERTGFRAARARFSALGSDDSLYAIQGSLELTAVAGARPEEADDSLGMCYAIDWKPDIGTLTAAQLSSYCQPTLDPSTRQTHRSQQHVSIDIRQQAARHCSQSVWPASVDGAYLQNYTAFLRRISDKLDASFDACTDWQHYLAGVAAAMPQDPSAGLQLTLRVAENLEAILRGETDPLTLFFSDDLLARYYSEILNQPAPSRALASVVDLLAHKNPALRVLEIGAGTGSASVQMLQTLTRNGDSDAPRFSCYYYTDISPGFFESARSRLAGFGHGIVEYKVLDIEQDPSAQGFEKESFDVVLAANVLHATSDVARSLSHVHWLMKPGGKLILHEPTQPDSLTTGFLFGLLPGWWLSRESQRQLSPLLTEDRWHGALREAGFSGLDVAAPDDSDERYYGISLLVSSKPVDHPLSKSSVTVVASQQSELQQSVAKGLASRLSDSVAVKVIDMDDELESWTTDSHSVCVFLPELERDCLRNMSESLLGRFKGPLAFGSSMIWLADSDLSRDSGGSDSAPAESDCLPHSAECESAPARESAESGCIPAQNSAESGWLSHTAPSDHLRARDSAESDCLRDSADSNRLSHLANSDHLPARHSAHSDCIPAQHSAESECLPARESADSDCLSHSATSDHRLARDFAESDCLPHSAESDCLRDSADSDGLPGSADHSHPPATHSAAVAGLAVGLSRVYKSEHTDVNFVHLALQVSRGPQAIIDRILQILHRLPSKPGDTCEDEYNECNAMLHVNRLVPETALDQKVRPQSPQRPKHETFRSHPARHTMMTVANPGSLDSFQFVDDPRFQASIGAEQVDVEIRAAGLNFRDLLVALGQVDDAFFGFECSGVVVAKGSAVHHLSLGDRVACLMQNTFATTARCHAAAAVRLPDSISFRDAAGILLTAATARYALMDVARLSRGESVLIHSGAGGLGQAAIQVAQAHDAVVYATVGTAAKRTFLAERYGIPEEHIFSSRTLEFASALKRLTNGRGVDVVLNSLSGEALRASWRCVAPFGRFLETGKKDILSSATLPMDTFSSNVAFVGIDLAHIIRDSPTLTGTLLRGVIDMAARRDISIPSPVHSFSASQIESAFRLMQGGESMGKIVVEFEAHDLVLTAPRPASVWKFDPEACYVVAGGLGGLGRSIAKWMASRGARRLMLLSRRTEHSPEVLETLRCLSEQGVEVATPSCDVSDRRSLRRALDRCSHLGRIRGCLQLSMVMREAEVKDATLAGIDEALSPKVEGTVNLDSLLPTELDFFVCFSSITGIVGSPGVLPYAMGNVFQDEFARSRVLRGRKAVSVDLGVAADVGYVAENYRQSGMQTVGFLGVTERDIHALLGHYCDPSLPVASPERAQVVVGLETLAGAEARGAAGGPWYQRRLFSGLGGLRASRKTEHSGGQGNDAAVELSSALRGLRDRREANALVLDALTDKLTALFGVDRASFVADGVDGRDQPLHALGLDSLVAIEIRNWFLRFVRADIAVFEILGNVSMAELVDMAVERSEYCS